METGFISFFYRNEQNKVFCKNIIKGNLLKTVVNSNGTGTENLVPESIVGVWKIKQFKRVHNKLQFLFR